MQYPLFHSFKIALGCGVLFSLRLTAQIPDELTSVRFSGPEITPCPACICAAPTGEVFVGVDMLGSLGKGPGKGKIVRLVDADGDGKPEETTTFAKVDNPRGLISIGISCMSCTLLFPRVAES